MFRVSREIDFCYGHRLLNYEGKCRYLHGHNGRAVISIEGEKLDDRGMVLDFSDIKKTVSAWIDQLLTRRGPALWAVQQVRGTRPSTGVLAGRRPNPLC